MSRPRVKLEDYLSGEELRARYRSCKDPKEARRWHALWLISQGYSAQQAGEVLGLQSSWVRRIVNRYNKDGPQGLVDGHRRNPGGAKPRLDATQQEQLCEALKSPPPGGGLWTGPKVATWIEELTGKKTHPQLGWVYLKNVSSEMYVERRRHNVKVDVERRKQNRAGEPYSRKEAGATRSQKDNNSTQKELANKRLSMMAV